MIWLWAITTNFIEGPVNLSTQLWKSDNLLTNVNIEQTKIPSLGWFRLSNLQETSRRECGEEVEVLSASSD